MQFVPFKHRVTDMIVHGSDDLPAWREHHRLHVPGYRYMPRYKSGQWDGTWMPGKWCRRVDDHFEMRCSFGMARRVARDLNALDDMPTRRTDHEANTFIESFLSTCPNASMLRDYQLIAARDALVAGWGRVALATNAGKGAIMAMLIAFAERSDLSALVLCDELAVYDALEGELAEWSGVGEIRRVEAGVTYAPTVQCVTLAMVPTLARRLTGDHGKSWSAWLARQSMVLLDEADKATAPTWRSILRGAESAKWRVGFSGTFPEPDNDPYADLQLDDLMGPVLVRARNMEMVNRGVSARPLVEIHAFDVTAAINASWTGTKPGPGLRQEVFEEAVVFNVARHAAIANLVRPDVSTAIVINRVAHGEMLERFVPGAVFIDGSATPQRRREVLEQFQRGDVRVLIVTKILDRGTNRLGHAADLIFASGEGSHRQTLQRIGRGLRRAGGKEFLRLVDIVDRVDANGNKRRAIAARYIHGSGVRRLDVYRVEGFDVEIHA